MACLTAAGCRRVAVLASILVAAMPNGAADADGGEGDGEDYDHEDPFPVSVEPGTVSDAARIIHITYHPDASVQAFGSKSFAPSPWLRAVAPPLVALLVVGAAAGGVFVTVTMVVPAGGAVVAGGVPPFAQKPLYQTVNLPKSESEHCAGQRLVLELLS